MGVEQIAQMISIVSVGLPDERVFEPFHEEIRLLRVGDRTCLPGVVQEERLRDDSEFYF